MKVSKLYFTQWSFEGTIIKLKLKQKQYTKDFILVENLRYTAYILDAANNTENHVLNGIREPIHAISLEFYHFERNESYALFRFCVLISNLSCICGVQFTIQSYNTASDRLFLHNSDGVCVVSVCVCKLFCFTNVCIYIYTCMRKVWLTSDRNCWKKKILNMKCVLSKTAMMFTLTTY